MARSRIRGRQLGITILEVMFSIGIVVIGVLGVISLIPLAAWQAKQGLIADEMAVVGQSALNKFRLRRMEDSSKWVQPGTSLPFSSTTSYCIDPLFVARHASQTPPSGYTWTKFPYHVPGTPATSHPRMERMTLSPIHTANAVANRLLAEQLFVWQDDLRFILPDDETLPPAQQFNWSPGSDGAWGDVNVDDDNNGVTDDASEAGWGWAPTNAATDDFPINRATAGEMSWMATLTPKLEDGVENDEYVLSIVIFHQRDLEMDGVSEQWVEVQQFNGGGYAGGDVQLSSSNSSASFDEVNEGDWMMLAAYSVIPDAQGTKFGNPVFRWYKILARDDDVQSNTLNVTLAGPDWSRSEWINGQVSTIGYLVPQVVGVYERTIRVNKGSTLWSQ